MAMAGACHSPQMAPDTSTAARCDMRSHNVGNSMPRQPSSSPNAGIMLMNGAYVSEANTTARSTMRTSGIPAVISSSGTPAAAAVDSRYDIIVGSNSWGLIAKNSAIPRSVKTAGANHASK